MIKYYNKIWKHNCFYNTSHQYFDILIQRCVYYNTMIKYCSSKKIKIFKTLKTIYEIKEKQLFNFIMKNYTDKKEYPFETEMNNYIDNAKLPLLFLELIIN